MLSSVFRDLVAESHQRVKTGTIAETRGVVDLEAKLPDHIVVVVPEEPSIAAIEHFAPIVTIVGECANHVVVETLGYVVIWKVCDAEDIYDRYEAFAKSIDRRIHVDEAADLGLIGSE